MKKVKFRLKSFIGCTNQVWLGVCFALLPQFALAQDIVEFDSYSYLPTMGCMIEPSVRVNVSSPVAGVIKTMNVKLGDKVKAGTTLFSLESGVEAAAVKLAKVRKEYAERQAGRNDELYHDELISMNERDEIVTGLNVAATELEHAEQVLALRSVKSPIDGIVVDRFNNPGEFVSTEPLLALASVAALKVEIVLPVDSYGSIPDEGGITVFPVAPVGGKYDSKITMVDPIIDAASGTFRVRAELANPEGKLPAGIKCRASLSK